MKTISIPKILTNVMLFTLATLAVSVAGSVAGPSSRAYAACGTINNGDSGSNASVVVKLFRVTPTGQTVPVKNTGSARITITTKAGSSTSAGNVVRYSSGGGSEVQRVQARDFMPVTSSGCISGGGVGAVLGYKRDSTVDTSGANRWVLDCDQSKHPGRNQEFYVSAKGTPGDSTAGGTWTSGTTGTLIAPANGRTSTVNLTYTPKKDDGGGDDDDGGGGGNVGDKWAIEGNSAVAHENSKQYSSLITVGRGKVGQFRHQLRNTGASDSPAISWIVTGDTNMQKEAQFKSPKGVTPKLGSKKAWSTVNTNTFRVPNNATIGKKWCQRIQFPKSKADIGKDTGRSEWACIVASKSGDTPTPPPPPPPPVIKITETKYTGEDPTPPGEKMTWTHRLTDTSYKVYKGRTAGQWYNSNGMKPGTYFDHVKIKFLQNENQPEMLLNDNLTPQELKQTTVPKPSNHSTAYWPREEDIGKTVCDKFEYELHVKDYVLKSEQRVHHYDIGTYVDGKGNLRTYRIPVYAAWYWIEIQPPRVGSGGGSTEKCAEVGKKPKVQILGGDVRVSGDVRTSLMQPYYRGNPANNDRTLYGSWSEYGIILGGTMADTLKSGTASASQLIGGSASKATAWSKLVIGNTNPLGGYTPVPNHDALVSQFIDRRNEGGEFGGVSGESGIFGEYGSGTISVGGNVSVGKSIIVRAGTINIDQSIIYDENYSSIAEIPQVVLVADNINISNNVERVDAWLLSRSSINTCKEKEPGSELTLSDCDKPLIVNGPVATNTIHLQRTGGSEKGSTDKPAETFNYRAEASIWARRFTTSSDKIQTVNTVELPSRF